MTWKPIIGVLLDAEVEPGRTVRAWGKMYETWTRTVRVEWPTPHLGPVAPPVPTKDLPYEKCRPIGGDLEWDRLTGRYKDANDLRRKTFWSNVPSYGIATADGWHCASCEATLSIGDVIVTLDNLPRCPECGERGWDAVRPPITD